MFKSSLPLSLVGITNKLICRALLMMCFMILAACQITPRMTLIEKDNSNEQHVIAQFLRSKNNLDRPKLAAMLTEEFRGKKFLEFEAYIKDIGGRCESNVERVVCIYIQSTPYRMYRPRGFEASAAIIHGVAESEIIMSPIFNENYLHEKINKIEVDISAKARATRID